SHLFHRLAVANRRAVPLAGDRYAEKPLLLAVLGPVLGNIVEFGERRLIGAEKCREAGLSEKSFLRVIRAGYHFRAVEEMFLLNSVLYARIGAYLDVEFVIAYVLFLRKLDASFAHGLLVRAAFEYAALDGTAFHTRGPFIDDLGVGRLLFVYFGI